MIVVLALATVMGHNASAQNAIEYTTLPSAPATSSNAIAGVSHSVAKKAAALSASLPSDTRKYSVSGSNGDRLESSHYLLTVNSLQIEQGETRRAIPLSAVNLDATIAANRERGVDLKIPKNKAEIMLSF